MKTWGRPQFLFLWANAFFQVTLPLMWSKGVQGAYNNINKWQAHLFTPSCGDSINELLSVSVHTCLLVLMVQTKPCLEYKEIHRNSHGPCSRESDSLSWWITSHSSRLWTPWGQPSRRSGSDGGEIRWGWGVWDRWGRLWWAEGEEKAALCDSASQIKSQVRWWAGQHRLMDKWGWGPEAGWHLQGQG